MTRSFNSQKVPTSGNNLNQNLINFRTIAGLEREGLQFLLSMELLALRSGQREHFGPEARDHAKRVLTRYYSMLTGGNLPWL
jgi:hypothetical protein